MAGSARRRAARLRPVAADVVGLREAAHARPLRAGERREAAAWVPRRRAGDARTPVGSPCTRPRGRARARSTRRRSGVWLHVFACPTSRSNGTSSPASAARTDASSSRRISGSEAESWTRSDSARGSTVTVSGAVGVERATADRLRSHALEQQAEALGQTRARRSRAPTAASWPTSVPRVRGAPRDTSSRASPSAAPTGGGRRSPARSSAVRVAVEVDLRRSRAPG